MRWIPFWWALSVAPPLVLSSNHLEESYSFHLLYEEILKDIKQPKLHKL